MGNGWYTWILKNKIYFLSFILLIGCRSTNKDDLEKPLSKLELNQLQTGDLICRKGNGFFSDYFRKYASRDHVYSHIGIISIDDGEIYVYHAEASELTGIGTIKKEPLQSFLKDIEVFGFYRIDSTQLDHDLFIQRVHTYYKLKPPFDLRFNSEDDSEIYCTELIAHSINATQLKPLITPTLELNHQLIFTIDDILDQPFIQIIQLSNHNTHIP